MVFRWSKDYDDYMIAEYISGDAFIPSELNTGEKIKKIGEKAFENCESLEIIDIPEGILAIYEEAFAGCKNAKKVVVPSSLKSISSTVFDGCTNIKAYEISAENKRYVSVDGIFYDKAYKGKLELMFYPQGREDEEYTVDDDVLLGDSSFRYCTHLKRINIPSGLTCNIDPDGFRGCANLEAFCVNEDNEKYVSADGVLMKKDADGFEVIVYPEGKKDKEYFLPDQVTDVSKNPFGANPYLEKIIVSENHRVFASIDGVLYRKMEDGSLVCCCYPGGKISEVYKIPEEVTKIDEYAFQNCSNLKNIYIPETVTETGLLESVFLDSKLSGCVNLENIYISAEHERYVDYDGAVFKKQKGKDSITALYYPKGRKETFYKLPDKVIDINSSFYKNLNRLRHFCIPDNEIVLSRYFIEKAYNLCISVYSDDVISKDEQDHGYQENVIEYEEHMGEYQLDEDLMKRLSGLSIKEQLSCYLFKRNIESGWQDTGINESYRYVLATSYKGLKHWVVSNGIIIGAEVNCEYDYCGDVSTETKYILIGQNCYKTTKVSHERESDKGLFADKYVFESYDMIIENKSLPIVEE